MKLLMEGWKDWLNRDKDVEEMPREKVSSISDIATGAELSEDATMVLGQLKDILEEWEEAEYESDEKRWKSYAADIQKLVDKHKKPAPITPVTGMDPSNYSRMGDAGPEEYSGAKSKQ
jgi:hypothetical protein